LIRSLPRAGRPPAKPRILLVDDHRGILDRVASILGDEFDVAGVATDGRAALDRARQLDPDAIVLDVNMPVLDGFETMRALEESGSRAPVVFLSMVDTEEHIVHAFRCGGRGYVVKPRVAQDLPAALQQVLRGRMFVPSLPALFHVADSGGHAMQVHGELEPFLDGLAAFFDLSLRRGDATCVIATGDIRAGLNARLQARGWQTEGPSANARYLVVDAAAALNRFMRNGLPDMRVLHEIAEELETYRASVTGEDKARLTIFGNMVVMLLAEGNASGAMALENLWNKATYDRPFFTLCGYPAACFNGGEPGLLDRACAEHWAISHSGDV